MGHDSGFFILVVAVILAYNGVFEAALAIIAFAVFAFILFLVFSALFSTNTKKVDKSAVATDKQVNDSQQQSKPIVTTLGSP